MKRLFQQAKTVHSSKRKDQIQDKPQDLREDLATVVSGSIRKRIVESG